MKRPITSLALGIVAMAAFTTAGAANDASAGTSALVAASAAWAAPAPNEPEFEPEIEILLQGQPDLENRPER